MTEIDTSDQVTSYRTIVSFESKLLEEFSYCILQQNNVFECDASIPKIPHVKPMKTWRGQALTKMVARGLLIGHLNDVNAPEVRILKSKILLLPFKSFLFLISIDYTKSIVCLMSENYC